MTTPVLRGLPADFRSFYRLFRRTCSASVLQRNTQSTALRNLYRTTFRRAGLVYMRAKNSATKDGGMKEKQEAWLNVWNKRMDNTLFFLYNSSHTRGLAHQITKFLGHFIYQERRRHSEGKNRGLAWNGQLQPDSPQYKPPPPKKNSQIAKQAKAKALSVLEEEALGPLREVVRMAEGRDEILFGNLKNYTRVKPRKILSKYDKFFR
ncbi:hypothetical protein Ac2012v2_005200 [Leucoagaricus gongylophorus]